MAKKFDISKYAAEVQARTAVPAVPAERDIEIITAEILRRKQNLANDIIGIGLCLIEAKAMLPHGEWLSWLSTRVSYSEKTAENYMRVAREFPNPQLVADLCQRQSEIVRKRRRNFVVFRRGGNKIRYCLAQKECSRFAAFGA